ncbi:MAG: Gldg family protein [Deltaproteobacteria bacterium]|nr:Gldg family protein [Deltaproteobacteria bacterium]
MIRKSPLLHFFLGLMAIYIAMRTLNDNARLFTLFAGGALLIFAILLAILRIIRHTNETNRESRAAASTALWAYGICIFGLIIYAIAHNFFDSAQYANIRAVYNVAWPFIILLGLIPALAIELAIASMTGAPMLELWRVKLAARSARIIVYSFIVFAALNYTASQWNRKIDLSYFHISAVSDATKNLVGNLSEPIRILLFTVPYNEAMEQAQEYLQSLANLSPQIKLEIVDQARAPDLAKEFKVRNNGNIVFAKGNLNETLAIGLEMESARHKLRKLDNEVQQRLLKLSRPPRTIYFTTGHMERDFSASTSEEKLPGLSNLKMILESLGLTCKRLGIAEGLDREIPKDAGLIIIAGPIEPFLPSERIAIKNYLNDGGRLLALLDPDHGVSEDELLATLGMQVTKALVANERATVRISGRGNSPYNFATIRASSHPSVTTLSKAAGRLAVVFLGAGAIVKTAPDDKELKQNFTIHSTTDSWLDLNNNGKFDKDREKHSISELAIAIEKEISPVKNPNGKNSDTNHSNNKIMRAIVVGDADVAANGVIGNMGNAYFMLDSIKWLVGEEELVGPTTSEDDVAIVHKRSDDTVWFYGVSFAAPAIILTLGLFTIRINKKRRQS